MSLVFALEFSSASVTACRYVCVHKGALPIDGEEWLLKSLRNGRFGLIPFLSFLHSTLSGKKIVARRDQLCKKNVEFAMFRPCDVENCLAARGGRKLANCMKRIEGCPLVGLLAVGLLG